MINVSKNPIAPKSLAGEKLKKSGSYREFDVVQQLYTDFHNGKCYLCEDKDLTGINVEHFVPHRGNIDLMFSWKNLFYCCSHCNNIKGHKVQFDNILDCTNPTVDVLRKVKLSLEGIVSRSKVKVCAMDASLDTLNTVELLQIIYNGEHTGLKLKESLGLRKKLLRELIEFNKLLIEFDDDRKSDGQKQKLKDEIELMLNFNSPFVAFKFWLLWGIEDWRHEFDHIVPYK